MVAMAMLGSERTVDWSLEFAASLMAFSLLQVSG